MRMKLNVQSLPLRDAALVAAALVALMVWSPIQAQVLEPVYDVEIKRPFEMPDFVAMDLGPDRIGR